VLTEINVCTDAKRGMSVEKIAKNRWLTEAQVRAIIRDNPTLFKGNEIYLRRNAIDQMRRYINDFEYLFQNYGKEVINQMRAQVDELEKLFEEHDRDADE
jgi:predicted transcriptional regulator